MEFTYKSVTNSWDIRILGYASIFNHTDSQNDIVVRGAFQNSLLEKSSEIKLLWQHDQKTPIGKITKIFEDEIGLYIEGTITSGTEKGREAIDLVTRGILDSLSIGFNVVKSSVNSTGAREIRELDLWEVSLVTFPANKKSKIKYKKQLHKSDTSFLKKLKNDLLKLNKEVEFGIKN